MEYQNADPKNTFLNPHPRHEKNLPVRNSGKFRIVIENRESVDIYSINTLAEFTGLTPLHIESALKDLLESKSLKISDNTGEYTIRYV